ncbi:MAG TPA: SRPBCC domain-containing protein [Rhizobiaceae bacterium]|nr:SRPBCC domain-containing protein [Rhizobiaceae bacterium]
MNDPNHKIIVTRRFKHPAELIYRAWTDPSRMALWAGDAVEADPRVGGSYRFENRDGDKVYVHTGEYLALEPAKRVRMSFRVGPDDPVPDKKYNDEFIEVKLNPLPGDGTEFVFTNGWNGDGMDEEDTEAVRAAWNGWFDKLEICLDTDLKKEKEQ